MENFTNKKLFFGIAAIILLIIIASAFLWQFSKIKTPTVKMPAPTISPSLTEEKIEEYVNEKGQKWSILTGEYKFSVAADKNLRPAFASGEINPLKIQPGNVQKIRLIVTDRLPVKSVVATIKTDTKEHNFPLRLVRTEAQASPETAKLEARYSVNEKGQLVINSQAVIAEKLKNGIISSVAEAEIATLPLSETKRYVFEGEWLITDTAQTTYQIAFSAETEDNEKNTFVMALSEPKCDFDSEGKLRKTCTITSRIDGVDNLNLSFAEDTSITLMGSATLVFNSGKHIDMTNGIIIINEGAQITKSNLYYQDTDQDRYVSAENLTTYFMDQRPGPQIDGNKTRVYYTLTNPLTTATYDCYEGNSNVYPGQQKFFSTPIDGDPQKGWDYDCDKSEEKGALIRGTLVINSPEDLFLYTLTGQCVLNNSYRNPCGTVLNPAVISPNRRPVDCGSPGGEVPGEETFLNNNFIGKIIKKIGFYEIVYAMILDSAYYRGGCSPSNCVGQGFVVSCR